MKPKTKPSKFDDEVRKVQKGSLKLYLNNKKYTDVDKFNDALADGDYTMNDVYATVDLVKEEGKDESVGKPSVDSQNGHRAYGHYTGNIDKNWSINLIEASTGNTLTFTYIGYTSGSIKVTNQNNYRIQLTADTQQLSEVVVTALGIKREQKSIELQRPAKSEQTRCRK